MINVYSFQKIISEPDCPHPNNISKTSHFTFGQNYKRLVANSKGKFDFRKFIQKNNQAKKPFQNQEQFRRNPLQQLSTSQGNVKNLLQNKAFKIRCYSRRTPKQGEKQQQQISIPRFAKCNPKTYETKERRAQPTVRQTQKQVTRLIRMHKLDNFQELESIATNIKVVYNNNMNQSDKNAQKAIIIDLDYAVSCLKSSSLKNNEKDKDKQYFRRRLVFILKRVIDEKCNQFAAEKCPQMIFKVQREEQIAQLLKTCQQCEFESFFCIFNIQRRFAENMATYNLTKINDLAQNIVMLDSIESFSANLPLLNGRHFIASSTFSQKANIANCLQNLFTAVRYLQIRFSAQQFQNQDKSLGRLIQIDTKQLLERVKQRKALRNCKKSSRQKRQRCQSSHQNNQCNNQDKYQDKNLQGFKQKILKYLKIVGNANNLQGKRSKQLSNSQNQEFQCVTGREHCSKTNYQVVSELIRLNSHVHKQIYNFQRKTQQLQMDYSNQQSRTVGQLKFKKIYVNILK